MAPPTVISQSPPIGGAYPSIPPLPPIPIFPPIAVGGGVDLKAPSLKKTAETLEELAKNCQDSVCAKAHAMAGGIYLAQNNPKAAQEVYQTMLAQWPGQKDPTYAILARALLALSQGRILDAKADLVLIQDHPYAQQLLQLIGKNDDLVLSLQGFYALKALVEDEKQMSHTLPYDRLTNFLNEVESRLKLGNEPNLKILLKQVAGELGTNFTDLPQLLEDMASGMGGEILRAFSIGNDTVRAQTLMTLVDERLLPTQHAGTAFVIAKILENHPTVGKAAQGVELALYGIKNNYRRRISMDILDGGATAFAASLLALGLSRGAFRLFCWRWFGTEALTWSAVANSRGILGLGLGSLLSTGVYMGSEKGLLALAGYDGKYLPDSAGGIMREIGADFIVTGLSNLLGTASIRLDRRLFKPLSPSRWFYTAGKWALRTPLKVTFWGLTGGLQGGLLYTNHWWQDRVGLIDRFRPGKPNHFLPESWQNTYLNQRELDGVEKTVGELLSHLMTVRDTSITPELRGKIKTMKRWIGRLNPGATPEQEELLLGIFWIAQENGDLAGSAKDYILKWKNEGKHERANRYFRDHKIPIQMTPERDFIPLLE